MDVKTMGFFGGIITAISAKASTRLSSPKSAPLRRTHSGRLRVGQQYLLEIPRANQRPLRVLLTVVRCDKSDGGLFAAQLQISDLLAGRAGNQDQSKSRRTVLRVALLAFVSAAAIVFYAIP